MSHSLLSSLPAAAATQQSQGTGDPVTDGYEVDCFATRFCTINSDLERIGFRSLSSLHKLAKKQSNGTNNQASQALRYTDFFKNYFLQCVQNSDMFSTRAAA